MKFRIREFSFVFSSANIIIIFARFLNSKFFPPREIRENQNLANITRSTVLSHRYVALTDDVRFFVNKI